MASDDEDDGNDSDSVEEEDDEEEKDSDSDSDDDESEISEDEAEKNVYVDMNDEQSVCSRVIRFLRGLSVSLNIDWSSVFLQLVVNSILSIAD